MSHCNNMIDGEFIFFVYTTLVGRMPDYAEYFRELSALRKKDKSRMDVLRAIASSGIQSKRKVVLIPDATEKDLQGPLAGDIQERRYLSLEDFTAPTQEMFLTLAYHHILRRDPDPTGLAYHLTAMNEGMPPEAVLKSMMSSEEARALPQQIIIGVTEPETITKRLLCELELMAQQIVKLEYAVYARQELSAKKS